MDSLQEQLIENEQSKEFSQKGESLSELRQEPQFQISLKWSNLSVFLPNVEPIRKKTPQNKNADQKPLDNEDLQRQEISVTSETDDKPKQKGKYILQGLTGFSKPGELMAIMGPSGAGKTTLMALLSQRMENNKNQVVTGDLLMNEKPYDQKMFQSNAALIMQNDILLQAMTVYESLKFAAYMKLKGTKEQKEKKIENIIRKLQLQKCRDTYVGGTLVKGISGGERKRVCIGVELVSEPSLILLDEPTSGLDSFTAFLLMNLLKEMAVREKKNIIFTIHQPSNEIYNLFDRLLLLKNGQEIFQGERKNVLPYFQTLGIVVPTYQNIPDCYMQLSQKEDYETSLNNDSYVKLMQPQLLEDYENYRSDLPIQEQQFSNTFGFEMKMIIKRGMINFKRNPFMLQKLVIQLFFVVFFIGSIWWQSAKTPAFNYQKPYTQAMVTQSNTSIQRWLQNVTGVLFSLGTSITMGVIGGLALLFPSERGVFLKEYNSSTYRVSSYFLAKVIIELPGTLINPILVCSGLYGAIALNWGHNCENYLTACAILISVSLVANGLGIMNGALFSNIKTAAAVGPLMVLPFMLFGGLYSNLGTIPSWISWMQYISLFKYFFAALMENQFDGISVDLLVDTKDPLEPVKKDHVDNVQDLIVKQFDLNLSIWYNTLVLLMLAVLFHILAFLFLKFKARKLAA